jgi:hypothetical protein
MLKQRHGHSITDYIHFTRQTFDDYNETCHMIDGSAAIQPHNLGLLMLRGISNPALSAMPNNVPLTPSTHTTFCPPMR